MILINQQDMIDAIEKCHKRCCRTDSSGDEWIHYETALNEAESIKPIQEIIHCKDCNLYWESQRWCLCGRYVKETGFCDMAEKKGEVE